MASDDPTKPHEQEPRARDNEPNANRPQGQSTDPNPDFGPDSDENTPFVFTTPDDPASGKDWYLWGGVILLLVLTAFVVAIRGDFVADDARQITDNAALTSSGALAKIWGDPHAMPQYYPVTYTVLWIEYKCFADAPLFYHLLSVLLHAMAGVLAWRILRRLCVPGAWVAAAVWAIHPLQAESVGYITELKNVLSGLLMFASIWFYLDFAAIRPPPDDANQPTDLLEDTTLAYCVALLMFVLAALAKSATGVMPAALIPVLWWKGRIDRKILAGLAPFVIIGIALGLFTAGLEHDPRGLIATNPADWNLTAAGKILVAGRAFWFYIGKIIWPARLSFIYPKWAIDPGDALQWVFPIAAVGALAALWLARRRVGNAPIVAMLWYAVMLFPAMGFFDVSSMRSSYVADHFQYLAGLGVIVLVIGSIAAVLKQREGPMPVPSIAPAPAGAAPPAVIGSIRPSMVVSLLVIVGLSGLTWLHASAFGDAYSLWTSTLAVNPDSWLANFSLASELALEARNDDAIGQADTASDKRKRAIEYYNTSLELRPHQYSGHNNLGFIYLDLGRFDDAEREFRLAIAESSDPAGKPPDYIEPFGPYLNLGIVLDHRKDYAQAIPVLQKASELVDTPDPRTGEFPEPRARALVYDYLAGCLYKIGRESDALAPQQRAVDLDSTFVDARYHLALLLEDLKKYPEATEQMREVIVRAESEKLNNQLSAKNPILPKAYNEMGVLLVGQHIQTVRDLYTAYEMFSTAVSYDPNFREAQAHLAMVSRMMKAAGLTTQPSARATTMATTRSIELPPDLSAQIQRELSTTRSSTEPTTIPSSGLPAPLTAPAP